MPNNSHQKEKLVADTLDSAATSPYHSQINGAKENQRP